MTWLSEQNPSEMQACKKHSGTDNAWFLGQHHEMMSSFPTQ